MCIEPQGRLQRVEGDGECLSLRSHDPNIPGNRFRPSTSGGLEGLEGLDGIGLHDMLMPVKSDGRPVDIPHDVYGNENCAVAAYCCNPAVSQGVQRLKPAVSRENVHLAMQYGLILDLHAMAKSVGPGAGERFSDLLCTGHVYPFGGCQSGLHMVLMNGQLPIVKYYLDLALISDQDGGGMTRLLRSKPEGCETTAFDSAMQLDPARAVNIFMDAFREAVGNTIASILRSSRLTTLEKRDLSSQLGWQAALRGGSVDLAKKIFVMIMSSGQLELPEELAVIEASDLTLALHAGDVEAADRIFRTAGLSGVHRLFQDEWLRQAGLETTLERGDGAGMLRIMSTITPPR